MDHTHCGLPLEEVILRPFEESIFQSDWIPVCPAEPHSNITIPQCRDLWVCTSLYPDMVHHYIAA